MDIKDLHRSAQPFWMVLQRSPFSPKTQPSGQVHNFATINYRVATLMKNQSNLFIFQFYSFNPE
jgi:hypothetical protein